MIIERVVRKGLSIGRPLCTALQVCGGVNRWFKSASYSAGLQHIEFNVTVHFTRAKVLH